MSTKTTYSITEEEETLRLLLESSQKAGATQVAVRLSHSRQTEVCVRDGKKESMEQANHHGVGLTVLVGKKKMTGATTDLGKESLKKWAQELVTAANYLPDDPWGGLLDKESVVLPQDSLETTLSSPEEMSPSALWDYAHRAEACAYQEKAVRFSEGAFVSESYGKESLLTSEGFWGQQQRSVFSASVSVGVGEGTQKEQDYAFTQGVSPSVLRSPEEIGKEAAQNAKERLGAGSSGTFEGTVIFAPRAARQILSLIVRLLSAEAVLEGMSFLKDKRGQAVFSKNVIIQEDPLDPQSVGRRLFDSEGVLSQVRPLVMEGCFDQWLHTLSTARRMEQLPTGHGMAPLGGSSSPKVSHVFITPSGTSLKTLIENVPKGVYVTDLIGSGLNTTTGDYSQGGAGFLIEKGHISKPVAGFAMAGSFEGMLKRMMPASDLDRTHVCASPALSVDGMMISG